MIRIASRAFSTLKPWNQSRILVTGCQGQLGVPLCRQLAKELGAENVIATDKGEQRHDTHCHFESLDVTDEKHYNELVKKHNINYIVHLAGILSALGEKVPDLSIDVNVYGSVNALRIAREHNCRIFIPSTIGTFGGPNYQRDMTPVDSI